MSLESWKEEFYPTSARAASINARWAVCHSIVKWHGLRPANLARHGLMVECDIVRDKEDASRFYIDGTSCALCQRHRNGCEHCPLAQHLGMSCDGHLVLSAGVAETALQQRKEAPYGIFRETGDPEPMIAALHETLAKLD